jgi:hypothetical protein
MKIDLKTRVVFNFRDIIDNVAIMPEKRWKDIENFNNEIDSKLKHEDLCGSYEKAYLCYCDSYFSNIFAEVGWVNRFLKIFQRNTAMKWNYVDRTSI